MADTVFECQKCGQCCEGKGGIVLNKRDLARLAAFLNLNEEEFKQNFCEISAGKLKISSGGDGYCVFYRQNRGCAVHEIKPDVCRAWPFFRGNLEDPQSLAMAKTYCPGIAQTAIFSEFVAHGLRYLEENALISDDSAANALKFHRKARLS